MFCSKCGKQTSDQAKFCNYCGNPVNDIPPKPVRTTAPAPAKKGKTGHTLITILVAVAVFFGVRTITEKVISGQYKDSGKTTQSQGSAFEDGFQNTSTTDLAVQTAMGSCIYGALYENNFLRYGMAKLYVPDYSVLPGEGDERDWLMSPDGCCLITAYKQLEILNISFEASTEDGLLDSYKQSYSDASMISFDKIYIDNFPVIRYIIGYTADGIYQYQGELIVFPSETTKETLRLSMFVDVASGYGSADINQILDTLEVSTDFMLTSEDTQTIGLNRITAK